MTGRPTERYLLLLPAALLLAATVLVPLTRIVSLSFTSVDLDGGLSLRFSGLETYQRLASDGRFVSALRNTLVFTAASVLLEGFLGTLFALLLHRRIRGRRALRAAVILPWTLPTAVMALGWAWIFNDSFGVANDLLLRAGLVRGSIAWLAQPATAMAAIVIADVWKTTPFVALVVLAGLQGIPQDVLEAAEVDGLTPLQRLRLVTLPLLAPALLVALLFRGIQAFAAFDVVYMMTGGGPGGSTETLSLYSYQSFFRYLDFGYGAALAVAGALVQIGLAAVAIGLLAPRSEA